jgi:hypothetical protein
MDGEGIDVGPKCDSGVSPGVDPATGVWLTAVELEASALDEVTDQLCSPVFTMCRLRVSMKKVTQLEHLRCNLLDEPCQLLRARHALRLTVPVHS